MPVLNALATNNSLVLSPQGAVIESDNNFEPKIDKVSAKISGKKIAAMARPEHPYPHFSSKRIWRSKDCNGAWTAAAASVKIPYPYPTRAWRSTAPDGSWEVGLYYPEKSRREKEARGKSAGRAPLHVL